MSCAVVGAEDGMVDDENVGSAGADMSKVGSNWIISPPCSMSLCCPAFWMGL